MSDCKQTSVHFPNEDEFDLKIFIGSQSLHLATKALPVHGRLDVVHAHFMMAMADLAPLTLLALGCLLLHAALAAAFGWHALQRRERWALMFALAYTLTSLRLLRVMTSAELRSVQELAISVSATVLLGLAMTEGSLRFLKIESSLIRRVALMTVFVVCAVTLLSALDGGLRWANGLWLIGALSLPWALMFFYQSGREPGVGHRGSGLWLLCFAGLIASQTAFGLIDRPLTGADSAGPLGLLGLNLLWTAHRRRRAGQPST